MADFQDDDLDASPKPPPKGKRGTGDNADHDATSSSPRRVRQDAKTARFVPTPKADPDRDAPIDVAKLERKSIEPLATKLEPRTPSQTGRTVQLPAVPVGTTEPRTPERATRVSTPAKTGRTEPFEPVAHGGLGLFDPEDSAPRLSKRAVAGMDPAGDDEAAGSGPRPRAERPEGAAAASIPAKSRGSGLAISILGFVLALGGGFFIGQWLNNRPSDVADEDPNVYKVALRGDEPQLGPDDALVTIIEFADYQCPYCGQAREPLEEAMAGFEGDVRLIYKHFPLPSHPAATPAAKAAWAAHQQGKFWGMHAYLFETKGSIGAVAEQAKKLDLDVKQFTADSRSVAAAQAVDNDLYSGAALGVNGTPAFFVNGHSYRGLKSAEQWRDIIEGERERAEAVVEDGVARAEVFASLTKDGIAQRVAPRQAKQPGRPDPAVAYRITADGRPQLGGDDALVTVVIFSDFQCPFCAKLAPVAHQLAELDDVRVVFRNLPLPMHQQAEPAALAALAAARQGKFWEMHDKLFAAQKSLGSDSYGEFAESLGLDVARFKTDMEDPALAAQLDADAAMARRFGIQSTPSAFINGHYLGGAQPLEAFVPIVDEQRTAAQALVSEGTAKSDVFGKLMEAAEAERKEGS